MAQVKHTRTVELDYLDFASVVVAVVAQMDLARALSQSALTHDERVAQKAKCDRLGGIVGLLGQAEHKES